MFESSAEPAFADLGEGKRAGARISGVITRLDETMGATVDAVAAFLLLIEIGLLLNAVISRYLLKLPMTWVEELATLLFLWLSMLGVVSALRRGLHMRLTFLHGHLGPRGQNVLNATSDTILLIFFAILLRPAIDLGLLNHAVSSPDLGIPGSWGPAASAISLVLMILTLIRRQLLSLPLWGFVLSCTAAVAIVGIGGTWAAPYLAGLGNINLLLFFGVGVLALIAIGVPIAFSFGTATVAYFLLTTDLPLMVIAGRINEGMSHFILLTIPLFIFLGLQIQYTGMAARMVNLFTMLLGGMRGGLGYVLLCAMYLVSGISGAKAADMAAVGPILVPAMKERGTPGGDTAALLATSAAAAETIPPSLVLIIIGSVTGLSITALFTGGLLPALVCMIALALAVRMRSRNEKREAPARNLNLLGRSFLLALPALILPFIIRTAVLEGVATATEVATIGIVYVLMLGIVTMRTISPKRMMEMLVETVALSGAILIIIALAGAMSWALTQSGFAQDLVRFMTQLPGGQTGFLLVSIVMFVVLGSVLEGIPAIVIFGPLLFPAARALGVHPVHYTMVVLLSMGLGLFAPPFGYGYYTACAIAQVSPDRSMKNMLPYLGALAAAILIVAAFPWLSTGFLR